MYNMYRKLGVTSRTKLPTLVNKQTQQPGENPLPLHGKAVLACGLRIVHGTVGTLDKDLRV